MTRLEKLRELIQATPAEKIDVGDWQKCFAGHACKYPEFQYQGLSLDDDGIPCFRTEEDELSAFEALEEFFGLLPREAFYLFAAAEYDRPDIEELEPLTPDIARVVFLARIEDIIRQREMNFGHKPRDNGPANGRWNWYGAAEE